MQKMIHFEVPELPPSINKIYRISNRRMYKIDEVREFENVASYYLPHLPTPIDKPCKLVLAFQFKDKHAYTLSDVSNRAKVMEDTLVLCKMLKNDNLIIQVDYKKELGGENKTAGYFLL